MTRIVSWKVYLWHQDAIGTCRASGWATHMSQHPARPVWIWLSCCSCMVCWDPRLCCSTTVKLVPLHYNADWKFSLNVGSMQIPKRRTRPNKDSSLRHKSGDRVVHSRVKSETVPNGFGWDWRHINKLSEKERLFPVNNCFPNLFWMLPKQICRNKFCSILWVRAVKKDFAKNTSLQWS